MTNDENNTLRDGNIEISAKASKDELSLKAKGAGLFVLIALCIIGLVILGYLAAAREQGLLTLPMMFLLYVTYELIGTLDALLGIRRVHRDD